MQTLVAVGGGEITARDTEAIDRHALDLTGAEAPTALFIPAASGDSPGYVETFHHYFGSLGAKTVALALSQNPSIGEVEDAILGADLMYWGGGSTDRFLQQIQRHGIPELIQQAGEQNPNQVIEGLSAGANAMGELCSTDHGVVGGPLEVISGLGYIPRTLISPHHIREADARNAFLDSVLPLEGYAGYKAIAIDDGAAYVVPGNNSGSYAISAMEGSHVRSITPRIGQPHLDQRVFERPI